MKLYISLRKSLNFGKLVKRAVQVHGEGGKIFTRMQWVNPWDASTGHGVRAFHSHLDLHHIQKHGLDKHPQYKQALADQGIEESTLRDWGKMAHTDRKASFYLPETEESAKHKHEATDHKSVFPHYLSHSKHPDRQHLTDGGYKYKDPDDGHTSTAWGKIDTAEDLQRLVKIYGKRRLVSEYQNTHDDAGMNDGNLQEKFDKIEENLKNNPKDKQFLFRIHGAHPEDELPEELNKEGQEIHFGSKGDPNPTKIFKNLHKKYGDEALSSVGRQLTDKIPDYDFEPQFYRHLQPLINNVAHGIQSTSSKHGMRYSVRLPKGVSLEELNGTPNKPTTPKTLTKIMSTYGMPPELNKYVEDMESLSLDDDNEWSDTNDKVDAATDVCRNHWPTIKSVIQKGIDESNVDSFVKRVQRSTLDRVEDHGMHLASHPAILRHFLDRSLKGDIKKYRNKLSKSNLTINTTHAHLSDIKKNGYVASDIESYVHMDGGSDKVKEFVTNMLAANMDFDEGMDHMAEFMEENPEDSISLSNVEQRADAEYNAMGLGWSDPKPCYVALNPSGKKSGGAPEYGDGAVLHINPSILSHCTANLDDTFILTAPVAKIHDMDHLKDIFIFKNMKKTYNSGFDDGWHSDGDEEESIPIELQYHKKAITPDEIDNIVTTKKNTSTPDHSWY